MPVTTLDSTSPELRDLFHKGLGALERGNYDYAINMFFACIDKEPTLVDVRKFLYAAEIKKFKADKPSNWVHLISTVSSLPLLLQAMLNLRTGAATQALRILDQLLRRDPLNMRFITLYVRAANAADMRDLALQTLAMARENYPENTALVFWLGNLHLSANEILEARECFEAVVHMKPNDGAALRARKNTLALQTLTRDGLASAESTRGLIRDVRQTELLEKESKAVRTESDTVDLIADTRRRIEQEPGNVNLIRSLAALLTTNGDFDEALVTLESARKIRGSADPELDAAVSATHLKRFDHRIAEIAKTGDRARADAIRHERNEYYFQDIQQRSTRYPNDLNVRYELGVALFGRSQTSEAIQQFQLSQRSPRWHVRSLYYLGLCFKAKQQYDMAYQQLEKAAAELPSMDGTKKDIVYELGLIREFLEDPEGALEFFKQVYQADIGYRDVARRVEQAYRR